MLRTFLAIIGIIVAVAIFVFIFLKPDIGIFSNRGDKQDIALTIDLQEIKPTWWEPIFDEGLLKINIDGDSELEWLFFYKNVGDANQIGGMIYDAQSQPRGDTSIPISQQYSAYLVPYSLMPDYVAGKNQGYMGDDAVQFQGVYVQKPGDDKEKENSDKKDKDVIVGDHLQVRGVFRGRTNRFAIFWWINQDAGYGGTLAYTPGWFSLSKDNPAWPDWDDDSQKALITTLWAWEPQTDRSNLCRRAQWRLNGDYFVADYAQSDLVFCTGIKRDDNGLAIAPAEPAFPESQVLAYLIDHNPNRWEPPNMALPLPGEVTVRRISAPQNTDMPPKTPTSFVDVDFVINGVERKMVWTVAMQQPHNVKDTVKWRIIEAHDR